MKYYIKRAGRISGPFSGAEVKSGAKMGRLLEQDLISRSKDGPWRTLEGVFQKIRAAEKKLVMDVCATCGEVKSASRDMCQQCGVEISSNDQT